MFDVVYTNENKVRSRREGKHKALKLCLEKTKVERVIMNELSQGRGLMRIEFVNGDHYEAEFNHYTKMPEFCKENNIGGKKVFNS